MKRRDFTRSLAALAAVPALPAKLFAQAPAAATAATASVDKMYFISWYTARSNPTCSPQFLAKELGLNRKMAAEVFERLVQNGTVSAPDAWGVSRTMDPLARHFAKLRLQATKRLLKSNTDSPIRDLRDKVKRVITDVTEDVSDEVSGNDTPEQDSALCAPENADGPQHI